MYTLEEDPEMRMNLDIQQAFCVDFSPRKAVKPTTMVSEPMNVAPEPTTMESEPLTMELEPLAIEPEPTTVVPEPTTVVPEPTTVVPEPSTVVEEIIHDISQADSEPDVIFQRPASGSNTPEPLGNTSTIEPSIESNDVELRPVVKPRRPFAKRYANIFPLSRPPRQRVSIGKVEPLNEFQEYELKPIRNRSFQKHSFTKLLQIVKEITVFLNGPAAFVYPSRVCPQADLDGVLMEYSLRRLLNADGSDCEFSEIVCFNDDVPRSFQEPPVASALMGRKMKKRRRTNGPVYSDEDEMESDGSEESEYSDEDELEAYHCQPRGTTPEKLARRSVPKPPPKPPVICLKPGEFSQRYEQDVEKNLSLEVKELYEQKKYLNAGIYSLDYKTGTSDHSDNVFKPFKFPLPEFFSGETLMNEERDFYLPLDITLFNRTEYEMEKYRHIRPPPFQKVKYNIFVERKPRKAANLDLITCQCQPSNSTELGCTDEECLNRCTCIECDPSRCLFGIRCQNQRFQRRQEVKELDTKERGFGLKTNVAIPRGSLITEYRGEIISQETCMERMSTLYKDHQHYYFLNYDGDEVLDGTRKGTDARFINHSCDPNCHIEKWQVGGEYAVGVFASKDIPANAELTYDYRFQAFGPMQRCYCRSETCRGYIGLNKKAGEKLRQEDEKAAAKAEAAARKKAREALKRAKRGEEEQVLPPTETALQNASIKLPPSERKFSLVVGEGNHALVYEKMQCFSRRQYQGQLPDAFKEIMKIRSHLRDTQLLLVRNYKPCLLSDMGPNQVRDLLAETIRKRRTSTGHVDELKSILDKDLLKKRQRSLNVIIEELADSQGISLISG